MATRIRTLNFLPEVFQTPTNSQFLSATLDVLVDQPNTKKIQGYIGSKFGYGINAKDYYVTEPTKTRTDYQLDPGVVFNKTNESIAQDFISYPGILDAIAIQGGNVKNNSSLFESEFYSWDSFTSLDKLINYNQYYWLPQGPEQVVVSNDVIYSINDFIVTDNVASYSISSTTGQNLGVDPTLTLLRGGTYTFAVNQNSQFWIQGEPGITGYSAAQPNIQTREVYGVDNNGATNGFVTFNVPLKNAQSQYSSLPGNNLVDVVSNVPFANINGQPVNTFKGIDGVTSLNGLRVLFYNTGVLNEIGYTSSYFSEVNYDVDNPAFNTPTTITITKTDNDGVHYWLETTSTSSLSVNQTIYFTNPVLGGLVPGQVYYISNIINSTQFEVSLTMGGAAVHVYSQTGTMTGYLNQGLYEEGYYSNINDNFYRIQYVGDPASPVIRLVPDGSIPSEQKITASYGSAYINRNFFKNQSGYIEIFPYISATLDTLYYQDGTTGSKVGVIRLVDNNATNTLDVEKEVLGKTKFKSSNGVVFTNGLKVVFQGDVIPQSYKEGVYYVEGVGSGIELIPEEDLIVPEPFTESTYIPWDTAPWGTDNWEGNSYIPVLQDYITIARNSINNNAWSRSNRWFHKNVINATAEYNNNPDLVSVYATEENKAKRPIIEFYPNLKLFNSGSYGKSPIDFIDFRTTDAFSLVAGQENYYPDVTVYTGYNSIINSCLPATSTTIDVPLSGVVGAFALGQYVADSTNLLPRNSKITNIVTSTNTVTLTITWEFPEPIIGTSVAQIIATDTTVDNYAVFDGTRIIFAADTDINVRNKIYIVRFSQIHNNTTPVITLTEAVDGSMLADEQIAVYRGYNNQGKDFWFDGLEYVYGQQKITVNQPPLFDVFDKNGISFGNKDYYQGSSFIGSKLFAYAIGSGIKDIELGFPIKYSSTTDIGDISFDVAFNADTFDYVISGSPITQNINTGYVFNYIDRTTYKRELGWQTAVGPSVQYQLFSFDYVVGTEPIFVCDIPADVVSPWPTVQVYINNTLLDKNQYGVNLTEGENTTTISLSVSPIVDTVVQVLILSTQVSESAYYLVPNNLNNNPLNENLTTLNLGDIRGQYQSIFYNNPFTVGQVFGSNNYGDLGNVVPYGTKIIQNSASLVALGALLRKKDHNLFDALTFNNREYIKFKTLLIDTVQKVITQQTYNPSLMLDTALGAMTATKTQSQSFFWSDMLPSKAPYVTNTYSFANSLDSSVYPLSQVYDFSTANYNSVLVYLTRTVDGVTGTIQLIRGIDYTVSNESNTLNVSLDLMPGDLITVKEYNQTYGSYCPNTPTKLGLYPASVPTIVLDSNYYNPTYFILGHDGSYTKLYGDYDPNTGVLIDFRDQVLLEFEKRIYNNLKLSNKIPIQEFEVLPGYFRSTTEEWNNFNQLYSYTFLDWVGTNRVDYKSQFYNKNNFWTFNYRDSGNKLDQGPLLQGYWRGVYQYFYDTTTPNTTPWQMIGYKNKPDWWENRYGPSPYTSDNLVLWTDMAEGIDWNNGTPIVIPQCVRPGLLDIIPVNSNGDLIAPFESIMGNYTGTTFRNDWRVGDMGPTELSYRRSSSWPFDLMRIMALNKPAKFYNLAIDLDNYKYNYEFNQYLYNDRSHLNLSEIQIYGNGVAKTSYLNWIIDYEKQVGIDATANLSTLFNNLDVRLVYRLAGFSDKSTLQFYVEKGSPNSRNASLLIPDESYQILLYDNQPFNKIVYSGVIIQSVPTGYAVFGNAQNYAYFKALVPELTSPKITITYENLSVEAPTSFYKDPVVVPYGTIFNTVQEVVNFLTGYGAYLESLGMVFNEIENGIELTWQQMATEFLYWVQSGWEIGSIVTLNPAATTLKIDKDSCIVEPLTITNNNFVLNENLYPIATKDLNVFRDETLFSVKPLNQGDSIGYGQFNCINFEHGIVFNNTTLFGDQIYNLITGLRQNRITLRGTKTAEWNGTVTTGGFILNQNNITEWNPNIKYTKGQIVTYKNKYWVALDIVQPKLIFEEKEWKRTDYDQIQVGMLPNPSTRAYESTLYYDVNQANLEQDADLLSFSLIGYRPRDYLALADLTDITQVNVYKNMIKNKGTRNAANAFKGANLPQGGIDYDIYENWAIKSGEFGGVLNSNFVEFKLNENQLTGNPSIVGLTNGVSIDGVQQEVPIYSLYNYGRPVTDVNILPTVESSEPTVLYPDAGYVNFNDVKLSSFYYSQLPAGVDSNNVIVPLNKLLVRDYIWLANYLGTWQVYTPVSIGQVIYAKNNLNNTVTLKFNQPHNLSQYDPLIVVNFNRAINNYYIVTLVVDPYSVIINLRLDPNIKTITGDGIGMTLQSQRVAQPSDIINLPLLDSEFIKNKVWVDTNDDGGWAVYRKSINYQLENEITREGSINLGSAVAYTDNLGYLITDSSLGAAYRFTYDPLLKKYVELQVITQGTSFGSTIAYGSDIVLISEPTSATPKVYVYQLVIDNLQNQLSSYQSPLTALGGSTNWGSSVAISGDQNWIYVSAIDLNRVYVYRKSQLTGLYENVTYITTSGLGTGDNFGYSIATDYYGDTVVIGAPDQNSSGGLDNWGYTYVFDRIVQDVEVQYNSTTSAQQFTLSYTPPQGAARTASATSSVTNRITCNASMTGFNVNDPVLFQGTNFGDSNIQPNVVYYIDSISGSQISIKTSRTGSTYPLATDSGLSFNVYVQTTPIYVSVNGTLVADNHYAVAGDKLVYTTALNAGDIVTISGQNFVLAQQLNTPAAPRVGVQFGNSLDTNKFASEIIVGAPFYLDDNNHEGAVFRFTNKGGKYGMIAGTSAVNVTTTRNVLINNYLVQIPAGNASAAALAINGSRITNVTASATSNDNDGKLIISLIDSDISTANEKLLFVALDSATFSELGFSTYEYTQTIHCPHLQGATQFGHKVKFNEFDSFVASAISGTRFEATTFDFSDDELDNDTVFDHNATQFIDSFANAGAVYMFDYLGNYNENILNPGKFVYAQSTNDNSLIYGSQPYYGTALDFNNNRVVVGTPDFRPGYVNGKVTTFDNITGQQDWSVYRNSSPVVDINRITDSQIFSAETNNTLVNLDYIDPLQGKILGIVRNNIDVVSNQDPARYNNTKAEANLTWSDTHLGQLWLDTSEMRYVNYHQNDLVYNSKYWGALFPNSNVKVYSWISSTELPTNYKGPGIPKDVKKYSVNYTLTPTGSLQPIYYYWVRNTNTIFTEIGKTLSDTVLETYIANSKNSGVSYFAPLLPSVIGLYNSQSYINANDSVYHVGYSTGTNDDVDHNQYDLIRADFADDFLPGLPKNVTNPSSSTHGNYNSITGGQPTGLYARLLDSLSGTNIEGGVIPDPFLPKAVQTGVLARPRQSFFIDRLGAVKNFVEFANSILIQYPFNEISESLFLYKEGPINPSNGLPFYNVNDYIENVNWWAPGYNNNTKSNIQVEIYADLSTLEVPPGTIVTVNKNGSGFQETYILENDLSWNRIGLQYGTLQISSSLYDYSSNHVGFGDNFWDTAPYDTYPSEETRYITRAFCEEIPSDLLIFRNKALILLFEYIQAESVENQNYLPWLNKTSFIDVAHTIRELLPYKVFKSDEQDFLSGYMNEIKPYHVVIKEFLFTYKGTDTFEGDITDFDLPAQYNSNIQQFVTPSLVFQNASDFNQYTPNSDIWKDPNYTQWYNNYGLSLTGCPNYPMTTLASYITFNTDSFVVDNASGLPINGVLQLTSISTGKPVTEKIGYSNVDYNLNVVSGLSRGLDGTTIENHIPGENIIMDLPPVIVFNSGRSYLNPPKIIAFVDPKYTQTATFNGFIVNTTLTITGITTGEIIVGNYIYNSSLIYGTQIVSQNSDGTYEINISQTIQNQSFVQYVGPREPAVLKAVMGADRVLGVEVLNPGSGYVVEPEIIIDPALSITFASNNVNLLSNTIRLYAPNLQTGDLIQYSVGKNTVAVGGLESGQWYYVNVLETSPLIVIGLYTSYSDCINDKNRVVLYTTGSGANQIISLGAKASPIVSSAPTRQLIDTLRFDRTSYNSRVVDWEAGRFYGAYYAGKFINTEQFSSSSIQLQSTEPPIDGILASAQGATFEIVSTANTRTINFDSLERKVQKTTSVTNVITLDIPTTLNDGTASGSTLGFYVGMPIKFIGAIGNTGLDNDRIYYVQSVLNMTDFKVSTSLSDLAGTIVPLNTVTVNLAGLSCYAGKPTDTATIKVNYPGITSVTATQTGTNKLTIPLNVSGSGGTNGFYTGLPIFFTKSPEGNVFGGVIENDQYYVTTVCDKQTFTMSKTNDADRFTIVGTNSSTGEVTISELTDNLNINDPIIFTDFVFGGSQLLNGQEYTIKFVGTTDFSTVATPSSYFPNQAGTRFIANGSTTTGTGTVTSNYWSNIQAGKTYYVAEVTGNHTFKITTGINLSPMSINNTITNSIVFSDQKATGYVTSQVNTYPLTTATGNMTININLPVSPGQVNGQKFTLYQTSETYPSITGTVVSGSAISRDIGAAKTVASGTYSPGFVAITSQSGGLTNLYKTMPITINERIGNLTTATTYYVSDLDTITVNCSSTSEYTKGQIVGSISGKLLTVTSITSGKVQIGAALAGSGITAGTVVVSQQTGTPGGIGTYNLDIDQTVSSTNITVYTGIITCDSTAPLYINMPILFSGVGLGGINIDLEYYVSTIVSSTQFTITNTPGGKDYILNTANGTMVGTGEPYIKLSATKGGSSFNPGNTQTTCTIDTVPSATFPGDAVVTVSSGYVPADGVKVSFRTTNSMPAGLVENEIYYVVGSSGPGAGPGTFSVSDNLGGTPKTISAAGSGTFTFLIRDDLTVNQSILTNPILNISSKLGGYSVNISGTNQGTGWAVGNQILIPGTSIGGASPANDLLLQVNAIDEVYLDPITGVLTSNGNIVQFICSGTPYGTTKDYYLKVVSTNELALFENQLMTIPASGLTLPYSGIVSTTATEITDSTDEITVGSTVGFNVWDPVVFTGNVFGGIQAGITYYIYSIPSSTAIKLYDSYNHGALTFSADYSGTMTMAKQGDYAFLPEPFYYDASIVKFNDQAWECLVSNNDTEFILGKWQLLDSGDRQLNALDRIKIYYQPTDNMPGLDLSQLVSGIRYPNSTYLGNPFAPNEQFAIDTEIPNYPFYPTEINLKAVTFKERFIAPFNTNKYSGVSYSQVVKQGWSFYPYSFKPYDNEGGIITDLNWSNESLAHTVLNITDIIYGGGKFVITTTNNATPIYVSDDGVIWTSNGYFTPYGSTGFDDIPYDESSLYVNSRSLTTVTYDDNNHYYYAAGSNIVRSIDAYSWDEVYRFTNGLTNNFNGIAAINTSSFAGIIAVGKGQRYDYSGPLSEIVDTNLITLSTNDFGSYTDIAPLSYFGLNAVASNTSVIVAAGENGIIYQSTNGVNWTGINETQILGTNGVNNTVTLLSTSVVSNYDVVKITGTSFGGLTAGTTYYVGNIDSVNNTIKLYTDIGLTSVVTLTTASPIGLSTIYRPNETINDLYFDNYNNVFVAVGNAGTIKTSVNGIAWTDRTSGVLDNLNGVYSNGDGYLIIVGNNNTILTSLDAGVTWEEFNTFKLVEPAYNIQGDSFTAGYGPEELVPGVVTDNLSMTVTTRPGTNWPVTRYAHVGYNVVSTEISPTTGTQTVYSFNNLVANPAQIRVAVLSSTNGLGTTIYENIDYTVNWIDYTITLTTPISLTEKIRIDVYETGNGDQLVKSSTKNQPIRYNDTTGWNEIYLNCYYAANMFQGGGVVQPGTEPIEVDVYATEAGVNTIYCSSAKNFKLNDPITFQGNVFGNLQEDTVYYVKTKSTVTNTITVSQTYNTQTGTAGATFVLTTATGSCKAIIEVGNGAVYTEPLVYHNGQKLVFGVTGTATRTKSATNSIQVNTSGGIIVNTPIVFSNTMFGNEILPQTVYYVRSIVDPNEFTISATPGGAIIPLSDATGGADFITNDYSFGLQPNGIQAKMLFASQYDASVDYLNYTIFGETTPEQYGYTIPEVQLFNGDNVTNTFTLLNYISNDSINNAIVEINGVRLNNSAYSINNTTNTIYFNTTPSLGDKISVTTYNLTQRQYLDTQFGITASPGSTSSSVTVRRTTNENTTYDAQVISIDLISGQDYVINTVGTTDYTQVGASANTVGTIFTAGKTTTAGSFSVDSLYDILTIGSTTWTSIGATSVTAGGFVVGEKYIITSVGTTSFTSIGASANTVGTIFTATGVGSGTGTALTTIFKATGVGSGTGTATCFATPGTGTVLVGYGSSGFGGSNTSYLTLASGDTSSLTVNDKISFNAPTIGGLQTGVTYYVTSIIDAGSFTVSNTVGGSTLELYNDVGSMASTSNTINVANIISVNNTITNPLATTNVYSSSSVGNVLTCASTTGFVSGQTIEFKVLNGQSGFGGVAVDGKVYYVENVLSGTTFTIMDETGTQVTITTNASPANPMVAFVGGNTAVRVTTGIPHKFVTNNLVRIDGTNGSVQLNNKVFYVHVINSTQFDLYEYIANDPTINYSPYLNAINYPVTAVNAYTSGGYTWIDGLFVLSTVLATDTTAITNEITLAFGYDTDMLTLDTPIYFTESSKQIGDTTLGGLVIGQKYFVREITSSTTFTVSSTMAGDVVTLTTASGTMNATEWEQTNVDRLYVTINGYRVPSSKLRLNPANFVSILTTIVPGDVVTISSMIPSATPNEEVYFLNVDMDNQAEVYRANNLTKTWLTQDLYNISSTIVVADATKITNTVTQTSAAPVAVDGYRKIGLTGDKNLITSIIVYNNTTGATISSQNYALVIEALAPVLQITDGLYISTGDSLTITMLEGNLIVIDGEQINFNSIDLTTNTLSGLVRGVNGTGVREYSPKYAEVYGLLSINQLSDADYNVTWNPIPGVYNETLGDPLQLANTDSANFLKQSN